MNKLSSKISFLSNINAPINPNGKITITVKNKKFVHISQPHITWNYFSEKLKCETEK